MSKANNLLINDDARDRTLSVALSDHGLIQGMTWRRSVEAPVAMHFRDDEHAGFSWHVKISGNWHRKLPLVRVAPGSNEFALTQEGVTYSLAYTVRGVAWIALSANSTCR